MKRPPTAAEPGPQAFLGDLKAIQVDLATLGRGTRPSRRCARNVKASRPCRTVTELPSAAVSVLKIVVPTRGPAAKKRADLAPVA